MDVTVEVLILLPSCVPCRKDTGLSSPFFYVHDELLC